MVIINAIKMKKETIRLIMKKIYSLMIIILSVCLIFTQIGYAQNVNPKTMIIVNGKNLETDKNIQLVNDCVYVPASDVFKALGYTVKYDADFKLVRAKKDGAAIVLRTNDNSAKVNGKMVQMNDKPILVKGSVFVPLDFIKESTGYDVSWNAGTFTVGIYKKSDAVSTPVRDVFEDQKVADKLSPYVNKTPDELMRLRTKEGSWEKIILDLVSEQKSIDKSMTAKFKSYFDSSEDTIIKMKYKLGNWVDVFGYLAVGKEKQYDSVFEYKIKTDASNFRSIPDKELVSKMVNQLRVEGAVGRISNILEPLCGKYITVGDNTHDAWSEAFKKVNNKIDFLDGARYIGMPESAIKELKDVGYFDYEIYIKARDIWVKGGSYTDKATGVITDVKAHIEIKNANGTDNNRNNNPFYYINAFSNDNPKIIYASRVVDISNVSLTDPVDNVVISGLKIPDTIVNKCKQYGISDVLSMVKLNIWGITDDDDIRQFKHFMDMYPVTIDELNEIRMDYISWQQITVFLFTKYK